MKIKEFIAKLDSDTSFREEFKKNLYKESSRIDEESIKDHRKRMSAYEDNLLRNEFAEKIFAVSKEITLK